MMAHISEDKERNTPGTSSSGHQSDIPVIYPPQDVFDAILDELVDDKRALLACSLVSQSLRLSSQERLFRDIMLDQDAAPRGLRKEAPDQLVNALSSSPRLTYYTKSLRISVFANALQHLLFYKLLPLMTRIEQLSIKYLNGYVVAQLNIPMYPTVRRLSLSSGYKVELDLLRYFPNLSFLRMFHVVELNQTSWPLRISGNTTPSNVLTALSLNMDHHHLCEFTAWLLKNPSLALKPSNITAISFDFGAWNEDTRDPSGNLPQLLLECAPTLEKVKLLWVPYTMPLSRAFTSHPTAFANLREIVIAAYFTEEDPPEMELIPWLRCLQGCQGLKFIHIHIALVLVDVHNFIRTKFPGFRSSLLGFTVMPSIRLGFSLNTLPMEDAKDSEGNEQGEANMTLIRETLLDLLSTGSVDVVSEAIPEESEFSLLNSSSH